MPRIYINLSGKNVPVYSDFAGSGATTQVGTILNREMYTVLGYSSSYSATSVAFYSPTGWRQGYIFDSAITDSASFNSVAFSPKYAYTYYGTQQVFEVKHRQSRIFSGTNVVHAVQPGGKILTDGESTGGETHPYRLSIIGYQDSGSSETHFVTNGWCDTDMEIGHDMYNTCTIDGLWV